MNIEITFKELCKIVKSTLKERTSDNDEGDTLLDDDIDDLAEIIAIKVRDRS